jgi:triosephosphate isomerase (TIM)
MTPIICVGESWAERESGAGEAVVVRQLDAVVSRIGVRTSETVIAYEPVWAIGTGRSATPEMAQAVHQVLRKRLRKHDASAGDVPLLYGGSVKAGNAKALFACADIDGGLIGGASLNVDEFLAIAGA